MVTETPAIVYNRNVHNRAITSASVPVVTGTVPTYASACTDNIQYWSACQCFSDIAPTTITVTAPTPTSTLVAPTCTQGVEYALWVFTRDSTQGDQLEAAYYNFDTLDRNALVGGVTPLQTGVVSQVGFAQEGSYFTPLQFDGISAPSTVNMRFNILEHRGYLIPSQAGTYAFQFSMVDDLAVAWVGGHACSGITVDTASLTAPLGTYSPAKQFSFVVAAADIGKPVPFRIFWSNVDGPAGHLWQILDPNGAQILGAASQKNPQIVSSCSGPGTFVPAFPAWESEY